MKIGYPCINRSLACTSSGKFRLASFSADRFAKTVENNLICLTKILEYNRANSLLFFRISSDLIPFASHPVCKIDWPAQFRTELRHIGRFINKNNFRISIHPDQFIVLNSPNPDVVKRSVNELQYHAILLETLGLDKTAKIQLHIGGVYGDKTGSLHRFIENYRLLDLSVKSRLVIENDDRLYNLKDCLILHDSTGIPILFDFFHHEVQNNGETVNNAIYLASHTWAKSDGILMADYSSQYPNGLRGKHAETINLRHFMKIMRQATDIDFDLILEIKDKEKSALKALKALRKATIAR